jgi:Response regulator containing a CheY-like receiver domain and an HTH DNA-binding domain
LEREEVDVLLINLHLHGETPLPTISAWRKRFPSVRFLIMGATAKPSVVAETTKWGAIGFVSRRDALAALLEALRRAAVGLPYVSSRLNPGTRSKSSDLLPALSPRETLILRNIAAGRPVRTIAENLGISTKTVERHKENIKIKLNLRSASEILREAVRVFPAEFDD